MRRIIFAILAAVGLLATVGLTPANAATTTPTLNVSYAQFVALTHTPSACAVSVPSESYTIPVPDAVAAEVNAVSRYGFHSITGYALLNSGAYPGQILIANRTRSGVYPAHEYHAFIPGLFGRLCSEWVQVVAQDS